MAEAEIKELNRLTTILLDIFEDQLDIGRLKTMAEASSLLDSQLRHLGRGVLRTGGRVSMASAKIHAETEYEKYKTKMAAIRHTQADKMIAELKSKTKKLPGP